MARIRPLETGWEVARAEAGAAATPAQLDALSPRWLPAAVPGTVASALRAAGGWDFGRGADLDKSDWWFRLSFDAPRGGEEGLLRFSGLATLASVWLNGELVLESDNMFREYRLPAAPRVGKNVLHIRCASLDAALTAPRKPRARWKTRLVNNQQLRWARTSLLGRIPGWCPPLPPIGPWRPVALDPIGDAGLRARLEPDGSGLVRVSLQATSARGKLVVGERSAPLKDGSAEIRIKGAALWWPHTHGPQPLFPVRLEIGQTETDLGKVGFRSVAVDQSGGAFRFIVNGVPVFCRGATWTTTDIATLGGSPEAYRAALEQVVAAGMNMLRISGTMFYENEIFFDLCDELGILVWQDFMFANMDYPADDPGFAASVEAEAKGVLSRLRARPCLAVLCGGSEVSQQAAMLGLPREAWTNRLFSELLPRWCGELAPGVPYIPSTPTGGALPFSVNAGVSHYYGVGAYRRPPEDARRAEVKFASECLAFSNVPEPDSTPISDSLWKERVPRDSGSDWDFEDVREHYMARMFGVDPARLRADDRERYMALARVTTGELMAGAFAEWRRAKSTTSGALVWLYRDLWPGAGWGVVDSSGTPKSPYYYLKRALQPRAAFFTDEGLNGLLLHIVNETPSALEAAVEVCFYRGDKKVDAGHGRMAVGPRAAAAISVEEIMGRFTDSAYAYRFGPPGHDAVAARIAELEAWHFPAGLPSGKAGLGLRAQAARRPDGSWALRVSTESLACAVSIDAGGHQPEDNYFHLAPGSAKTVPLRGSGTPRGSVSALNASSPTDIET